MPKKLLAILQMYEFSSKSQPISMRAGKTYGCWRYCKCTSFQANHNHTRWRAAHKGLLAILQMYEFSSKSQPSGFPSRWNSSCWRYCKCTSFQANHNTIARNRSFSEVVGDTANVRVFKQITTAISWLLVLPKLLAILQMYEFSSKSQLMSSYSRQLLCCWRYCKCTSFQANHNACVRSMRSAIVVGDTANVRVFKQITTTSFPRLSLEWLLAILQMYEFSSKSQLDYEWS